MEGNLKATGLILFHSPVFRATRTLNEGSRGQFSDWAGGCKSRHQGIPAHFLECYRLLLDVGSGIVKCVKKLIKSVSRMRPNQENII